MLEDFRAALVEAARSPLPFMVDKADAARLCGMCVNTYTRYVKLGLLPKMNEAGRVCVETVRRACLRLDGIAESDSVSEDPAERALDEWDRGRGRKQ